LSPAFFSSDGRRPYTQRWSQSVQWMPASGTVVEIGYLGARGVRLRVPRPRWRVGMDRKLMAVEVKTAPNSK